jgi:uncharacterized protein (TIGR03382 family)
VVVPADDAGAQRPPEDSGAPEEDTGVVMADDASVAEDGGVSPSGDSGPASDARTSSGNGAGGAVRETSGCTTTGAGGLSAWLGVALVLGLARRRGR